MSRDSSRASRAPGRLHYQRALQPLACRQRARPEAWLKLCDTGFSLSCQSVGEFLDCGAILAWRCGLPQYRQSALDKAASLPPLLAARALGTEPEHVADVIRNLSANPWIAPQESLRETSHELKIVAMAGAFRGFAGQFLTPPRVECIAGELLATDGDTTWRLHADIYNALLLRCEPASSGALAAQAEIKPDGTVRWRGQERRFPELARATSLAATSDTVAVTIATSHHLFLLGLS